MSNEKGGHDRPAEEKATALGIQTPINTVKLTDFLPSMAERWFEIGLKLGCKDTAMQLRYSTDSLRMKSFLVIDEWINKEENACWEYLCRKVLRSEGVGLSRVADRIEEVI